MNIIFVVASCLGIVTGVKDVLFCLLDIYDHVWGSIEDSKIENLTQAEWISPFTESGRAISLAVLMFWHIALSLK